MHVVHAFPCMYPIYIYICFPFVCGEFNSTTEHAGLEPPHVGASIKLNTWTFPFDLALELGCQTKGLQRVSYWCVTLNKLTTQLQHAAVPKYHDIALKQALFRCWIYSVLSRLPDGNPDHLSCSVRAEYVLIVGLVLQPSPGRDL